jgi:hypothetical protein
VVITAQEPDTGLQWLGINGAKSGATLRAHDAVGEKKHRTIGKFN